MIGGAVSPFYAMATPATVTPGSRQQLERACAELYRLHQAAMVGYSRLHGCNEHDAQDAVQELFFRACKLGIVIRLWESPVDAQRAWMFRVLRWIIANQIRRRCAARRGGQDAVESLDKLLAEGQDVPGASCPAKEHDRALVWGLVDRCLARMRLKSGPDSSRRVPVSLFHMERRGTASAERVALHRMRRRLRDLVLVETAGWRTGEDIREVIRSSMAG